MNKKILIIGSQGYLGSRLCQYLSERGLLYEAIDTGFFKDGILYKSNYLGATFKDAREIKESDIENFDAIVLLAGISNDPFGNLDPKLIYNPTRDYAIAIANLCKAAGIKFIFPSSCSVYGAAGNSKLNESAKTNPQTYYSKNKIEIEEKLKEISGKDFRPIALRFATIYGMSPRIRFDVVINMLSGLAITSKKIKLNSNGEAWRPNLHIDDACEAIYCSINWINPKPKLNILNVGKNEDNFKIIDLAKLIKYNVKGSSIDFLDNKEINDKNNLIKDKKIQDGVDSRTYIVSFDKILQDLPDFKCKWNVKNGISDLIDNLHKINLNEEIFNNRHFYRLQQIEFLHKKKKINNDLRWL